MSAAMTPVATFTEVVDATLTPRLAVRSATGLATSAIAACCTAAEVEAAVAAQPSAAVLSGMVRMTSTLTLPAVVARSSRKHDGSLQRSSTLREAAREALLASKEAMSLERVRPSWTTVEGTDATVSPAPMGENGGRGGGGGGEGEAAREAIGGYGGGKRGGGGAMLWQSKYWRLWPQSRASHLPLTESMPTHCSPAALRFSLIAKFE